MVGLGKKRLRWNGTGGPHVREGAKMAVHTGLSKVVCGHLVSLDRDPALKVATVVVRPKPGQAPLSVVELSAVTVAAELVERLARRVLGPNGWRVVEWGGQVSAGG